MPERFCELRGYCQLGSAQVARSLEQLDGREAKAYPNNLPRPFITNNFAPRSCTQPLPRPTNQLHSPLSPRNPTQILHRRKHIKSAPPLPQPPNHLPNLTPPFQPLGEGGGEVGRRGRDEGGECYEEEVALEGGEGFGTVVERGGAVEEGERGVADSVLQDGFA